MADVSGEKLFVGLHSTRWSITGSAGDCPTSDLLSYYGKASTIMLCKGGSVVGAVISSITSSASATPISPSASMTAPLYTAPARSSLPGMVPVNTVSGGIARSASRPRALPVLHPDLRDQLLQLLVLLLCLEERF